MAQFSSSDISEAKRRVKEMQEKAKSYTQAENQSPPPEREKENKKGPEGEKTPSGIFDILSSITSGDDGSKGLILALILLLSREKADNMLILALLYILL